MNNFLVPFQVCFYCGGEVTFIALVATVCLWSGGIPEKVFPRFDNIFQVYLMRRLHFLFSCISWQSPHQLDLQNIEKYQNNFLWYLATLETYRVGFNLKVKSIHMALNVLNAIKG